MQLDHLVVQQAGSKHRLVIRCSLVIAAKALQCHPPIQHWVHRISAYYQEQDHKNPETVVFWLAKHKFQMTQLVQDPLNKMERKEATDKVDSRSKFDGTIKIFQRLFHLPLHTNRSASTLSVHSPQDNTKTC